MSNIRDFRESAFCWQEKEALWDIRRACKDRPKVLAQTLLVYVVLTELASNKNKESFKEYITTIRRMAGIGKDKATTAMKILQEIGLLSVVQGRENKGGKFDKTQYTLTSTASSKTTAVNSTTVPGSYVEDNTIVENNTNVEYMSSDVEDKSSPSENKNVFSYSTFITGFNKAVDSNYKGDIKSKRAFNARIKEGYEKEDFWKAIYNASQDKYLMGGNENKKRYLTPEYITRSDKLENWVNAGTEPVGKTPEYKFTEI